MGVLIEFDCDREIMVIYMYVTISAWVFDQLDCSHTLAVREQYAEVL